MYTLRSFVPQQRVQMSSRWKLSGVPLFLAVLTCMACVEAELNPTVSPTLSPTSDKGGSPWSTVIRYAVPIVMLFVGVYCVAKYFVERGSRRNARNRLPHQGHHANISDPGSTMNSLEPTDDHDYDHDHVHTHDHARDHVHIPPPHIEMSSPHVPPVYTAITTDMDSHVAASSHTSTFDDDMLPPTYESLVRDVSGGNNNNNAESEI